MEIGVVILDQETKAKTSALHVNKKEWTWGLNKLVEVNYQMNIYIRI